MHGLLAVQGKDACGGAVLGEGLTEIEAALLVNQHLLSIGVYV